MGKIYMNTTDSIIWWGEEPEEPLFSDGEMKVVNDLSQDVGDFIHSLSEFYPDFSDLQAPTFPNLEDIERLRINKTKPFTWTQDISETHLIRESWDSIDAIEWLPPE